MESLLNNGDVTFDEAGKSMYLTWENTINCMCV